MPGYEILIMLAVVVLLVIAALFAVPRVMRTWTAKSAAYGRAHRIRDPHGKGGGPGPSPR